ncbi:MAG: GC-type dockerin domain-anchored protein [Planctomycetota bacterium]
MNRTSKSGRAPVRLGALACLLAGAAAAKAQTLAEFEGMFSANGGFTFGTFDTGLVENANSVTIDVTAFGGAGNGVGEIAFDPGATQLRVRARRLAGNVAESFRVVLVDNDGDDSAAGLGDEDWIWRFSTDDFNETDFTDVVIPLSAPQLSRVQGFATTNDGDEALNPGLTQWQIQSSLNGTDRLHIEVDEIVLEPVAPDATYVLADYGDPYTLDAFGFAGFDVPTVTGYTETTGSIIVDLSEFGGLGKSNAADSNFDASTYALRVTAMRLPGNEAPQFDLILSDRDGDDSAAGLGLEDYGYNFNTADFSDTEFTDVLVPISSFNFRLQNADAMFDGDGVMNPGLFQYFIQSTFGATDRLNMEFKEIAIEAVGLPKISIVDFDSNGGTLPGIFDFGAFTGGFTFGTDSATFDVSDFGGFGIDFAAAPKNFDASLYEWSINGRVLPENVAAGFTLVLVDIDGDDSGPGLGVEEYQFFIPTADFTTDFSVVTQSLTDPGPVFRQQGFSSLFDGDMVQNYDAIQWQIQSTFGSTDRLAIEIDEVCLTPIVGGGPSGCALADITTSGECSPGTGEGVIDLSDFSCYLSEWSQSSPVADITVTGTCDPGMGGDGVDLSDFSCYLSEWSLGCP